MPLLQCAPLSPLPITLGEVLSFQLPEGTAMGKWPWVSWRLPQNHSAFVWVLGSFYRWRARTVDAVDVWCHQASFLPSCNRSSHFYWARPTCQHMRPNTRDTIKSRQDPCSLGAHLLVEETDPKSGNYTHNSKSGDRVQSIWRERWRGPAGPGLDGISKGFLERVSKAKQELDQHRGVASARTQSHKTLHYIHCAQAFRGQRPSKKVGLSQTQGQVQQEGAYADYWLTPLSPAPQTLPATGRALCKYLLNWV